MEPIRIIADVYIDKSSNIPGGSKPRDKTTMFKAAVLVKWLINKFKTTFSWNYIWISNQIFFAVQSGNCNCSCIN